MPTITRYDATLRLWLRVRIDIEEDGTFTVLSRVPLEPLAPGGAYEASLRTQMNGAYTQAGLRLSLR